jgi:hypothetical protein
MLSTRLVQLIESNWEEIAKRTIQAVRANPDLQGLAERSDLELREWCRAIVQQLGQLLSVQKDQDVERRFELLGRKRFEESIPLHEAVLRIQILKDKIIGFVHEQGFPMSAMHLYAEEELEQRMGRFFDDCVYHLVRGYEDASRLEQRLASGI